ncbi:MAG: hypothetical protein R3F19_03300 [Verrucomicrobiales bacterium]
MRGEPEEPTLPHWGGQFAKLAGRANWYVDDRSPEFAEAPHAGARTVNRWRTDYLRDWQLA